MMTVGDPLPIIEGIGDELLYSILVIGMVILPGITYMTWRLGRRATNQTIHPDSAATVDEARNSLQNDDRPRQVRQDGGPELTCPVCIGDAEYAVETNCGHMFCGRCIIAYWQHGHWLGCVKCPVCRQPVTLLLFNFTNAEATRDRESKAQVIRDVNSYNRRFSGLPRPIMDYVYDLPTLLRHMLTEFFTLDGLLWMFRLRIIICFVVGLLYFASPFDIIPEAAFGLLGLLDDVLIMLLLAIYVSIIYRQFVEWRATRGGQ